MQLTELHALVDGMRAERDALHEELHAVLANDDMTVKQRKEQEGPLRARIKAINEKCYPLEVVRGKSVRLLKGEKLTPDERKSFEECKAAIGEPIEIG